MYAYKFNNCIQCTSCLGRFDLNDAHVVCTACHTAFTNQYHKILYESFWPGSAGRTPTYLFHQDVFRFFMLLRHHNPGISHSGFLRTLEMFSLQKGRVRFMLFLKICTILLLSKHQLSMPQHLLRHLLSGNTANMTGRRFSAFHCLIVQHTLHHSTPFI